MGRPGSVRVWWGVASCALMALGAFGPWVTALGESVSGTDGSNDGWIVVGAAVVGLIADALTFRTVPGRGKAVWCLLAGGLGTAVTIYDRHNVDNKIKASNNQFVQALARVGDGDSRWLWSPRLAWPSQHFLSSASAR